MSDEKPKPKPRRTRVRRMHTFDPALLGRLEQHCEATGTAASRVIELALRAHLEFPAERRRPR